MFSDAEVLKMLKEKDAEIEALKAELAEERELVEVHKQEADALAAILAKRAARLAAKNGGEGPSSAPN
jgi:peptidoglycan hydrolase CwlO-like protein